MNQDSHPRQLTGWLRTLRLSITCQKIDLEYGRELIRLLHQQPRNGKLASADTEPRTLTKTQRLARRSTLTILPPVRMLRTQNWTTTWLSAHTVYSTSTWLSQYVPHLAKMPQVTWTTSVRLFMIWDALIQFTNRNLTSRFNQPLHLGWEFFSRSFLGWWRCMLFSLPSFLGIWFCFLTCCLISCLTGSGMEFSSLGVSLALGSSFGSSTSFSFHSLCGPTSRDSS